MSEYESDPGWQYLRQYQKQVNYLEIQRVDKRLDVINLHDIEISIFRHISKILDRCNNIKIHDSKKSVWIPNKELGFIAAEIKSVKGDSVILITCKGVEKILKKYEMQKMNPPKYEKTEDMANLMFLNDTSVLDNLHERCFSMMIYVS